MSQLRPFFFPYIPSFIIGITLFIFYKSKKEYLHKVLPIFLIALLPLGWYIALANHTILHTHFVYRHMIIFMTGVLISLAYAIDNETQTHPKKKK